MQCWQLTPLQFQEKLQTKETEITTKQLDHINLLLLTCKTTMLFYFGCYSSFFPAVPGHDSITHAPPQLFCTPVDVSPKMSRPVAERTRRDNETPRWSPKDIGERPHSDQHDPTPTLRPNQHNGRNLSELLTWSQDKLHLKNEENAYKRLAMSAAHQPISSHSSN